MRTYTDRSGRRWEVVAGRESWGTVVALFVPDDGIGGVRSALLEAVSYEEANTKLAELGEERLAELLAGAGPIRLE